jgi:hypothetical protein
MGFSRQETPGVALAGSELTGAMVGIGMIFSAPPTRDPNIEDTLIGASLEGMREDDVRLLSVLTNWLGVHHPWINADRLTRALEHVESDKVRAYWAAVGQWLGRDRRFNRLRTLYQGPRIDLLTIGSDFQIKRRGEDVRFQDTPLRVPAGVLRERRSDILTPHELAQLHLTYRERIHSGPTYRADMWAELERNPGLTPAELAHRTYGSYGTAWNVKRDFELLRGSDRLKSQA